VRRRLLHFVTVLSLLLCVASVVMGVRSYWVHEQWNFAPRPAPSVQGVVGTWHRSRSLASGGGRLMLLDAASTDPDPGRPGPRPLPPGYQRWVSFNYPRPLPFNPAQGARHWSVPGVRSFSRPPQIILNPSTTGMGLAPGETTGPMIVSGWRYVDVSWWLSAVSGALLPAWRVWRRAREQRAMRKAKGLCLRCGYDLRATPGRCPECGASASVTSRA